MADPSQGHDGSTGGTARMVESFEALSLLHCQLSGQWSDIYKWQNVGNGGNLRIWSVIRWCGFIQSGIFKGRCYVYKSAPTLQRHNTENLEQIFPEKAMRGLSPNFHIHVSVSNLYIPTVGLPILLQAICGPVLGIHKSLTGTWMWYLGLRPRYSFSRNTYMGFPLQYTHSTLPKTVTKKVVLTCFQYTLHTHPYHWGNVLRGPVSPEAVTEWPSQVGLRRCRQKRGT
jgi:hypothetical protein